MNQQFKVEIDFDEASKAWRQNKISLGNGHFAYKCQYIHSDNIECHKPVATIGINNLKIYNIDPERYARYKCHINKDKFCIKHLNSSKLKYHK